MDLILCRRRNKGLRDEPIKLHPELVLDDPSRSQAKNSGFVTLQERIRNLSERQASVEAPGSADSEPRSPPAGFNKHQQYATLQELFAGKSMRDAELEVGPRKPKVPVMKLSKEDWNVKCWEERFGAAGRRSSIEESGAARAPEEQRPPARRLEVFQGRIEEVASKLEKVKEGAPLDEDLYRLNVCGGRGQTKVSHEWTDMLKQELESGAHNPRQLRSKAAPGTGAAAAAAPPGRKSPLNRPIRKIFEEESDNEEPASHESNDNNE